MKKILFLVLFAFLLTSCTLEVPKIDKGTNSDNNNDQSSENNNNQSGNENEDDSNRSIAEAIQAEYDALKAGTTTNHTVWTVTGTVVDMSATKYNATYSNFNVKLIIEIDGIYIGVYNGFVDGTYPTNIDGLDVGIKLTITGTIKEDYTLTSGQYTAQIEFSNPEIVWGNNSDDIPDNPTVTPNTDTSNVYFAMINDTHGAFVDTSDGYSIARVDTLLDQLEDKNGRYIKVANGDILQGSYISSKNYGYQLIESLNEMDFDAFVLGNHEFDWGIDKIAAYKDGNLANGEADFPFLAANLVYKSNGKRPDWIDAYTIIEYGDLKVGIIGLIGGDQESDILTTNVQDYNFIDDPTSIVKECAKELRNDNDCDIVIVSTHDHNESLNNKIAKLTDDAKIDAILCAHTHQLITQTVTRADGYIIPVLQNYDKNETVRELVLNVDENENVYDYSAKTYYASSYELSSDFNELFAKYQADILESERVLGTTASQLSRASLGSMTALAMYQYDYNVSGFDQIDLSILNTAGVRATIDRGEITIADVFNTFPFDNKIYLVKLYGSEVNSLLNGGYFYTYSTNSMFVSNNVYTIAIIDYVYFGTYYTSTFNKKVDEYSTGILMRDVFIDYIDSNY